MAWQRIGNLAGAKGADGRDAEPPDAEALATRILAFIPTPSDGRDGKDADSEAIKSAVVKELRDFVSSAVDAAVASALEQQRAAIADLVRSEVALACAALPPARDGKDGKDGTSVDFAEVKATVAHMVTQAVAEIPKPVNGKDGAPGKEGIGLSGAMVSRDGELVLTLSDGSSKNVGIVVGKDGAPGERGADGLSGKDGLGFDDIAVEHDGERGFTFKFLRGDQVKTFGRFTIPSVIYRGIWQDGQSYEKGDSVTFGGSQWIAKDATSAKPGEAAAESRAWQLAVKVGRDGKQGPQGPAGPGVPVVRSGR